MAVVLWPGGLGVALRPTPLRRSAATLEGVLNKTEIKACRAEAVAALIKAADRVDLQAL